jgi:hypothetical protein
MNCNAWTRKVTGLYFANADPAGAAAALANKEEADARSVFVGNVLFPPFSIEKKEKHSVFVQQNVDRLVDRMAVMV